MISSKISSGKEFLTELSLDEMEEIAENFVTNLANKENTERVLNGEIPKPTEELKNELREKFMKSNKKFINILKDEMSKAPMDVKINIAGKQKYLAKITDKLVNVFRTILAKPDILSQPPMAKLFNEIIESSGL